MEIYLHKSLYDLSKAGQLSSSANPESKAGGQRGGKYFHRIQVGYNKDNSPSYRYFDTKDEWDGYVNAQKKSKEKKAGKKKGSADPTSAARLKDKVKKEHEESSKRSTSLFVHQKDKDDKAEKSLYVRLK